MISKPPASAQPSTAAISGLRGCCWVTPASPRPSTIGALALRNALRSMPGAEGAAGAGEYADPQPSSRRARRARATPGDAALTAFFASGRLIVMTSTPSRTSSAVWLASPSWVAVAVRPRTVRHREPTPSHAGGTRVGRQTASSARPDTPSRPGVAVVPRLSRQVDRHWSTSAATSPRPSSAAADVPRSVPGERVVQRLDERGWWALEREGAASAPGSGARPVGGVTSATAGGRTAARADRRAGQRGQVHLVGTVGSASRGASRTSSPAASRRRSRPRRAPGWPVDDV